MHGRGCLQERGASRWEGDLVSQSRWRCRNLACATHGGAVLGRVTADDGLVLDAAVQSFAVFLDTRKAVVSCSACRMRREFPGMSLWRTA